MKVFIVKNYYNGVIYGVFDDEKLAKRMKGDIEDRFFEKISIEEHTLVESQKRT